MAVLAAGLSLWLAGCSQGGEAATPAQKAEPGADAPRAVRVATVAQRPLGGGLAASGLLVAREEAAVGAELAGYRVAAVHAEEGDYVGAGEPLVRMDETLLRAQIGQLQANAAQARVQAQLAAAEAARVAGLDNTGVLAQEQIEQRRAAARSAQAAVAAAEAQVAELRTRLTRMTIRSPVAGRVLERNVRPGEIAVGGGTPMFRIARGGLVELDAEVAESDLARLSPGAPAEVTLPSGRKVTGSVRMISPRVEAQTRLGRVRVSLPPSPDLRPGGFGQAVFTGMSAPALAVPEPALQFDANGAYVMQVAANNKVRRTPVRTGRRAGGFVELLQGPPAGSVVVLSGSAFIIEGDVVKPVLGAPVQAAAPAGQGAGTRGAAAR